MHKLQREVPERFIYFVIDGQNVFDNESFKFCYIEVNQGLSKMVPQNIWDSRAAKRADFFQKVELAKPAQILQS